MDKHTPDDVLVAAFITGDTAAFGILSERYRRKLIAQAYLFVKDMDMAKDVVQETLMHMMKVLQRGLYNETGNFSSWMFINNKRRALNEVARISKHRKLLKTALETRRDKFKKNLYGITDEFSLDPEALLVEKELRKGLYAAINVLDPQFRESLLLRTVKELKYEQIAQETGANINTIRTRLRLGTKKVRVHMQKADLL